MLFYKYTPEEALRELSSSAEGLSRNQAASRLAKYGANTLALKGEPLWRKLVEPFASVVMGVLLVAVVVSLFQNAIVDSVIIIAIMLISAAIYYVQRFSTERILRSLQKKSSQVVDVIRSGDLYKISVDQLVPGDVVQLNEGDKVPADIRILQESSFQTDEAILTGESVPVAKNIDAIKDTKEIYEQANIAFQGSFVVSGTARGIVFATGNNTEFGRIAVLANKRNGSSSSPVQEKIDKLITRIIAAVGGAAVVAFGLTIYRGMEMGESLRYVIALSVSAVPESLPIAISVVLVLGMRRMAGKKALVRSMNAIETVGVITSIATDKTGTLTKNKLSIQEVWQPDWSDHRLSAIIHKSANSHGEAKSKDPLDIAFIDYVSTQNAVKLSGKVVSKLPFDQAFSMSGNVWYHKGEHELVVKGAPEQIAIRSTLTRPQMSEVTNAVTQLTSQGYRVLAVASTKVDGGLDSLADLKSTAKFSFAGLVAVADTIRPSARTAIAAAQRAGVTVRMITGDHLETAYNIGLKLGLVDTRDQVFDSRLMIDMTDKQLATVASNARIFSRVTPENKYRILTVLKLKEVTAMTGDGVNDVPALANAHVGVAMGSGAQIAKDTGDIVLLNDDFASIVRAMREGRIIFSNIRRMLFYLLSTNIGEVLTTVGALVVGMPMPLAPVQILWINLVTDTTMVIPLGLEPGEKSVMKQKPIKPNAPILDKYMVGRIILVALMMSIMALSLYGYFAGLYGTAYGQTVVFVSLVVVQWANALNARSTYESVFSRVKVWHGVFWGGLAIAIFLQWLALFGPLQKALHVSPIAIGDIFTVSLLSFIVTILVVEIHKWYGRKYILAKQIA